MKPMVKKSSQSQTPIKIVDMPVSGPKKSASDNPKQLTFTCRANEPLDDLVDFFRSYLVLPDNSFVVMAAWVAASYTIMSFDRFPYLAITAPTIGCGKTRVLEVLELVCHKPKLASSISPPVLFRTIAQERPTLLFDEAQATFRGGHNSERSNDLKTILCSSISKTSTVQRMVGKNWDKVGEFSTYCPKVLSFLGSPDTMLADRCLPIPIKKKTKDDEIQAFIRHTAVDRAEAIRGNLATWVEENRDLIEELYYYFRGSPFEIDNDRFAELLTPLQAVLTCSDNGYANLLDYTTDLDNRDKYKLTVSERLLFAIREIFNDTEAAYLPSKELLGMLCARDEEPWSTWSKGEPMNPDNLAYQLKQYEIYPDHSKDKKSRGYFRDRFEDAFGRYLPELS